MASKKDKLGKAAKNRVDEILGGRRTSNMEEFVREMRSDSADASGVERMKQSEPPQPADRPDSETERHTHDSSEEKRVSPSANSSETGRWETGRMDLKKRRDSIYNISSDIRLEDYTEGASTGGGGIGGKARLIAGVLLFALLGLGLYYLVGWFFGARYMLAVASEDITAENISELSDKEPSLSAGHDVHIRFQWPEDKLKATYIRVKIDRVDGSASQEQAVLGQKPPRTANYVYFKGPMDAGDYHVEVTDESGSRMKDRDFKVR